MAAINLYFAEDRHSAAFFGIAACCWLLEYGGAVPASWVFTFGGALRVEPLGPALRMGSSFRS